MLVFNRKFLDPSIGFIILPSSIRSKFIINSDIDPVKFIGFFSIFLICSLLSALTPDRQQ